MKRPKVKEMELPNELFVQPQLLEQLSTQQDKGMVYYGKARPLRARVKARSPAVLIFRAFCNLARRVFEISADLILRRNKE